MQRLRKQHPHQRKSLFRQSNSSALPSGEPAGVKVTAQGLDERQRKPGAAKHRVWEISSE
jgi:hypothetical protein